MRPMPPDLAALLREPLFAPRLRYQLSVDDYMLATIDRARAVYARGLVGNDMWCGQRMTHRFPDHMRVMGWLGAYDLSLLSAIVGHQLAGHALMANGAPEQVERHVDDINTFRSVYAFAVTEVGGGSDLRRIQTVAHYDHDSRTLRLRTPNAEAAKCWISNSVHTAQVAMVLARLVVQGQDQGHHWLRVPLREAERKPPFTGVHIRRADPKGGIPAVQTSIIGFEDGYALPLDALMSGWAQIDADGSYRSPFPAHRRYAQCMQTFVQERLFPVTGAAHALSRAAAIALIYSTHRHTFRRPLLDNPHYRARLMPLLARALAFRAGVDLLVDECTARYTPRLDPAGRDHLYALTCAFKAAVSWETNQALGELRELCGGHGFHSFNEIVTLRNDFEINTTFAGDNTILCYESIRTASRTGFPSPLDESAASPGHAPAADVPQRLLGDLARHLLRQWAETRCPSLARPFAHAACAAEALRHWRPGGPVESDARLLYAVDSLLALLPHLLATDIADNALVRFLTAERTRLSAALGEHAQALLGLLAVPAELLDVPIARPDYAGRTLELAAGIDDGVD